MWFLSFLVIFGGAYWLLATLRKHSVRARLWGLGIYTLTFIFLSLISLLLGFTAVLSLLVAFLLAPRLEPVLTRLVERLLGSGTSVRSSHH